jgi:hypothetical protein
VVVGYLDVESVTVAPAEADPPLVIHADTVLPLTVPEQLLQAIARGNAKIPQRLGRIEDRKLALSHPLHIRSKLPGALPPEDLLGLPVTEAPNHRSNDRPGLIITSSVMRERPLLYALTWLYLSAAGAGPWSLAALRRTRSADRRIEGRLAA